MITLYSKATSNGRKASIMLEESGLDYRVRPMDLDKGEQKEDWYLAINPNGRIPCIVDDDGPDGRAVTVFESGAILIYLAEKAARLLPEEPGARMEVLNWLFFASGHITHTGLGVHWQIRCRDAGEEHTRTWASGRRKTTASMECSTGAWKDGTFWRAIIPSPTCRPTPGSTAGRCRRSTSTAIPMCEIGWRASALRPAVKRGLQIPPRDDGQRILSNLIAAAMH